MRGASSRTIRKNENNAGIWSVSCARSAELLAKGPAWTLPLRPVERRAAHRRRWRRQEVASQALVSAPFRKYCRNNLRERCVHYASSRVRFAGNVSGGRGVRRPRGLRAELHVIKTLGYTVLRGECGDHKNYRTALRNDPAAISGLRRRRLRDSADQPHLSRPH